jgi:hypothetical protein
MGEDGGRVYRRRAYPHFRRLVEVKRLGRNGSERIKGDERILGDTESVLQKFI